MSTSPAGSSASKAAEGGGSVARSSAIMAAGTLASRLLGFVRNALLVAALGATGSGAADAFNISNSLSTQLYNLLIGGILNAILVPQIVRALRKPNGDELVNRLLTAASMLLLVVAGILTAASPLVIMIYASGLGRWQPLAFAFAFWCMPQVFFYGLYALWGQVLNARSSFGPYMWSPVLNNLISIASLVAYLKIYGGYAGGQDPSIWTFDRIALIGATTTLGIVLQAVVLYVPLRRIGFKPRFIWGVRGMGLGETSKVALWALLGVLLASVGDWATTNLSSRALTAGESAAYAHVVVPSTTLYANTQLIFMLPQSLITTSIITALFTRMSEKAAAGDSDGVRDDFSLGLRSVGVFTVLCGFGISVLGEPALQAFVPSLSLDAAQAAAPMMTILGIGVITQGLWFTVQRVMLAYADTKRLLRADAAVGLTMVVFCLGAYLLAPATQWMAWACAGIVAGHTIGTAITIPLLRRHVPHLDGRRIMTTYARLVLAVLPAAAVGYALRRVLGPADGTMTGTRATDAVVIVVLGALVMTLVYLVVARLLRISELSILFSRLSRVVARIGRILPGGAGRATGRLAERLAPAPVAVTARAGESEATSAVDGAAAPTEQAVAALAEEHPGTGSDDEPDDDAGSADDLPGGPDGGPSSGPSRGPSGPGTSSDAAAAPAPGAPYHWPGARPGGALERSEGGANRTLGTHPKPQTSRGGARTMSESTPIGTGRYELVSTLPTTLPRVVRHLGRDTILDREVTVLTLGNATEHREDVLRAASRAVLIEDPRVQRVYDVEQGDGSFIVMEPAASRTLTSLVEEGLSPEQVRAVVGETAQALDIASRRGLNHLHLSPDSVRLRPDGSVQVTGIGIEAAVLGLDVEDEDDPLAFDRTDARSLVELLYYGLTRRWPGKRSGIPSAPFHGDAPAAPSTLLPEGSAVPDIDRVDALVERTWGGRPPISAAEVARALSPWDASVLPATEESGEAAAARSAGITSGPLGVLGRLRGRSSAHAAPRGSRSQTADVAAEGQDATAAEERPAFVVVPPEEAQAAPAPAPQAPAPVPSSVSADDATLIEDDEDEPDEEEDEVSRSVSRTTFVVLVAMLLAVLIGVFFAVSNLLQLFGVRVTDDEVPAAKTVPTVTSQAADAGDGTAAATPSASASPTQAAPIALASAESLDPYGDDSEHPELAATLIDGSTDGGWYSRYYASPSLAFKQGIGVAVTLQQAAEVSSIEMQGTGTGGNVQIHATSADDPQGGTLLAEGAFTDGTTTFSFPATNATTIVVWITDLPTSSDGLNKATISEITLR